MQLELKTFNRFVTLTVVAHYFDDGFVTRIELVLRKQNLSSAPSASHTPDTTNHIVQLRGKFELREHLSGLVYKYRSCPAEQADFLFG